MRRWVWKVLLMVLVVAALSGTAMAAELKDDNFQYEKIKVGTEDAYKVVKYIGDSKTQTAEIPSTFMSEGDKAPLEVVQIAGGAFANVRTLTKLIVPGQITEITADIFAGTYLKEIEFRNYTGNESDPVPHIKIEKGAFENCTELKTVTLSNSVAEIGEDAFKGCSSLKSIVIPESVTSIGKDAFIDTDLTSVTFLRSIVEISGAFPWGQLEVIHCPQSSNSKSVCKRLDYLNVGAKHIVHAFRDYNYDITSMPHPCQSGGEVKLTFTCPGYDYIEIVTTPNPEAEKDPIKTERTVHVDCTYTDKDCYKNGSFSMTQKISPIPHTAGETGHVEGRPASCTEAGYTDSWTCTVCGEPFIQAEIIPAFEHMKDGVSQLDSSTDTIEHVKDATCTGKGIDQHYQTCKLCKEKVPVGDPVETDMLEHVFLAPTADEFEEYLKEYILLTPTSCKEDGRKGLIGYRRICSTCGIALEPCGVCDKEDVTEEELLNHWKSFLSGGSGTSGAFHRVVEPELDLTELDNHPVDKISIVKVEYASEDGGSYDCTKGGKKTTTYECEDCQTRIEVTEDVAVGVHVSNQPEKMIPADCTHGSQVIIEAGKCTICHAELEREVRETGAPLGHDWGPFQEGTPPSGSGTGSTDTPAAGEGGAGGENTGGESGGSGGVGGESTGDGANGVSVQADGDSEEEGTASTGTAPCGEDTKILGYVECTRCHVTLERIITVPATGKHTWGEWTVVKAATATENGLQERICSVCGRKDTQVLPATGSGSSSGDGSGSGSGSGTTTTPTVTSYTITLISTSNGAITSSSSTAQRGDRVTLTVQPASGYELDWIRITTSSGSYVNYDYVSSGLYRFTMPSSNVEVRSYFTQTYTPSWATTTPSTGAVSRWTEPGQTVASGVPRAGTSSQIFSDIPMTHWAAGEINWASNMGYMTGSGGRFNPDGTITFQQMWMVLARISGGHPGSMADARNWAVINGFAEGGNPTHTVARHQLVTALYRTANIMGTANYTTTSLSGYPDSRTVPTVARTPMAWAVANGIVGGNANGRLDPFGTLTRAQFAVVLYRFAQRI